MTISVEHNKLSKSLLAKLIGALVLLIMITYVMGVYYMKTPSAHPSLQQIENITQIDFPDDARIIYSRGRRYLGVAIWAEVEMHKRDLRLFLASLPNPMSKTEKNELGASSIANAKSIGTQKSINQPIYIKFDRNGVGKLLKHYKIIIKPKSAKYVTIYLEYT